MKALQRLSTFKLFFYMHWTTLLFEMHITLTLLSDPLLKYSNTWKAFSHTISHTKNDLQ